MMQRSRWVRVLAMAGMLSGLARAQDLTMTGLSWVNEDDPPDTLPVVQGLDADVNNGRSRFEGYAYALVRIGVTDRGGFWTSEIHSTHPSLRWKLGPEASLGRIQPAKRGGKAVTSEVWATLIYNPASAHEAGDEAKPRLRQVVPARVAGSSRKPQQWILREKVTVGADGRITQIEPPEEGMTAAERAARRALQRWVFAPGRSNGRPVESQIEVPVLVLAEPRLEPLSDDFKVATIVHQEPPVFPPSQRATGFDGGVVVEFVVNVEGQVSDAYVIRSNNAAFDEAALTAVLKWRFRPAQVGGHPVMSHMQVPIYFTHPGSTRSPFEVVSSRRRQENLPPEFRYDTPPRLTNISPLVYPFDALLARRGGDVEFAFVVDTRGRASVAQIFSSPGEDFSAATRALVDTMRLQPATKDGHATNALLRMKVSFDRDLVSNSAKTLLEQMRKVGGRDAFVSPGELDEAPRSLSQEPPSFPSELKGTTERGEAVVEIVVDQHGIAQLPRIVSASHPAFGYAACQAIASWRFAPARRDGRAVPIRLQVPVEFRLE